MHASKVPSCYFFFRAGQQVVHHRCLHSKLTLASLLCALLGSTSTSLLVRCSAPRPRVSVLKLASVHCRPARRDDLDEQSKVCRLAIDMRHAFLAALSASSFWPSSQEHLRVLRLQTRIEFTSSRCWPLSSSVPERATTKLRTPCSTAHSTPPGAASPASVTTGAPTIVNALDRLLYARVRGVPPVQQHQRQGQAPPVSRCPRQVLLRRGRPRPPPSRSAAGMSTLSLDREVSSAPLLSMARHSGAAFLSSALRYTTQGEI
jgi:hypothetical protein